MNTGYLVDARLEVRTMRILIANTQSKVRYALSVLLQEQQGWKTVGNAVDAGDVLAKIISLKPDVLLLD